MKIIHPNHYKIKRCFTAHVINGHSAVGEIVVKKRKEHAMQDIHVCYWNLLHLNTSSSMANM